MNPKGIGPSDGAIFWRQRIVLVSFLALCCELLTGCPHNDYTVELNPTANGVERTLTFYRADGSSNGVPNYQAFPTNELKAIARVYAPNAVKPDGKRFVAKGEFSGALPKDVGGAGSYTNLTTSLGASGLYLERFRGNDDLVARTTRQYGAADKITDLIIGWARTEFARERGWKNLRKFLDEDFRHDLKNAARYFQTGAAVALSGTNAPDEFTARFCQYLLERGYLRLSDAPKMASLFADGNDDSGIYRLVQQLVAEKMEIPACEPPPKSLAVLADTAKLEKSWTNYLAKTDLYRAQVKDWERKRKSDSKLERPKPADAMDGLFAELLGNSGDGGETDHLTVKLALGHAPNRSNGKWQDGRVVWEAELDPNRALPVLCFASWSDPRIEFQGEHFGRVILDGDDLAKYCLWQNGLDAKLAGKWETLLSRLQPGPDLKEKLEAFQFSGQSDIGRNLLVKALAKEPGKSIETE
jgi:hypothetical protein